MKPHFGFVSPNCLNIHTNPGQRENGKLVWRRRFMNQLRDPIYVGFLRPEPGNFLTLIPTDFSKKAKLLLRVPHSGHDLPHLGPIFDTGCCVIWHWGYLSRSKVRGGLSCEDLTSISWDIGPQNIPKPMVRYDDICWKHLITGTAPPRMVLSETWLLNLCM